MKTVYICEKCGTQYENYDLASRCEDCHSTFTNKFDTILEAQYKWAKQGPLPTTAILAVEKEVFDEETREWKPVRVFGQYQLKNVCSADQSLDFIRQYEEAEAKERAEWEAYVARREAAKKAEKEEESVGVGE